MATGKLTKRTIDAAVASERTEFLWDDEVRGFGLRVTPNGAKAYIYQFRVGGREAAKRRHTIGRHGSPWTPESARKEAKRLSHLVETGVDPVDADRERRRMAVDLAFSAYVDIFADRYLKSNWKRWEESKRLLVRHAVPVLGRKALPNLKRGDLNAIWDRLEDRPATAKLMHSTLRKLFRWAVSRGDIDRSPLEGVEGPAPVKARDRVLPDHELAVVWTAAGKLGEPFGSLFRLLILTGQRREEIAALSWSELSHNAQTWTLPAERAKNGVAHEVPLSASTIAILNALAGGGAWPRRGLVFATGRGTAVSGFSKAKLRLDAMIEGILKERAADAGVDEFEPMPAWRIHDLRRTLATGLQRLGVRFEVTEAVLNHVSGSRSGIAGVYQRHDWKEEKREALEAWAGHLQAVVGTRA